MDRELRLFFFGGTIYNAKETHTARMRGKKTEEKQEKTARR
jgi:hypothetical protein